MPHPGFQLNSVYIFFGLGPDVGSQLTYHAERVKFYMETDWKYCHSFIKYETMLYVNSYRHAAGAKLRGRPTLTHTQLALKYEVPRQNNVTATTVIHLWD
jgi:hypothetical protein